MTGIRREKRNRGSLGKNGAPGMMGMKEDKDHEGSRGSSGPPGIKGVKGEQGSKGEKGEIVNSAVSQTNWKTVCVEKDDSRDSGKIKEREYQQNLQFIPYITIIRDFSAFMDRFFLVVFLWLLFQPICIYFFSPEIQFCSRIF